MPGLERDGRLDTKGHRSGRWQVMAWGVLVGPGLDPDDAARLLPTSLGLGGLWVCGLRGGMVWGSCRPAWPVSSSSSSTWWWPSGPSSSKPLATRPCSISADRRRLLDTLHLHTHAGAWLEASRACRAGGGEEPLGQATGPQGPVTPAALGTPGAVSLRPRTPARGASQTFLAPGIWLQCRPWPELGWGPTLHFLPAPGDAASVAWAALL